MKAGVLYLEIKPAKLDEFRSTWDQHVGELRKEKGLLNAFLFINSETGKGFSVGLYESEEYAKSIQSTAAFQNFLSGIRSHLKSEPKRVVGEVTGDLVHLISTKKAA